MPVSVTLATKCLSWLQAWAVYRDAGNVYDVVHEKRENRLVLGC